MKIEKKLANPKYFDGERPKEDIKYIVIQNIDNIAMPHYHLSDGMVIQVIPDDKMTDAVSGPKLTRFGVLHGICSKYNSISIGVPYKMSVEDKQTCINLIMTIKQRYKIDNDNVIRQMDVTGVENPIIWKDKEKWISDIKNKLIDI